MGCEGLLLEWQTNRIVYEQHGLSQFQHVSQWQQPYLLRLLLVTLMSGKDDHLVVSIALLCATWVSLSRGSTRRHYFLPLGDPASPSVAISNLLTARTHAVPVCRLWEG